MKTRTDIRAITMIAVMIAVSAASTRLNADTSTCGGVSVTLPFTDVMSSIFFCEIAEAYFSGITNGTSPTTYGPHDPVPREQMAAFVSRTMDQSVKRASRRAALGQFWTTQTENNLALTTVGISPNAVKSDGTDLWVACAGTETVSRVRASDGRLLETWTGAGGARGLVIAMGKVFVVGDAIPGKLYQIDPTQPPGVVTTLTGSLGDSPAKIAFDGMRIWSANHGTFENTGSISIVTLSPLSVTTVTKGFANPRGIVYDGTNMWVSDSVDNALKKLDSSGNVLLSVPGGIGFLTFDGTNIWVPGGDSLIVVRATGSLSGTVLATLTGNGLNFPYDVAFDGERILVTNIIDDSVSLWRASDLTPIGNFSVGAGTGPRGVCSDGLNFWITLQSVGKLARF